MGLSIEIRRHNSLFKYPTVRNYVCMERVCVTKYTEINCFSQSVFGCRFF